ncbi:MAG: general stress protein CsbD [Tatlockia sp.]|nr:general stress protein CsbD [Tatlockia sp.]
MNKDIFQGKWEEIQARMKKQWYKLSNEDYDEIQGSHQEIYRKLQRYYGYTRDEAEKAVKKFQINCKFKTRDC